MIGTLNRSEWYQLGYAYYKVEKFSPAISCFQNSVTEKDSISQNAQYHLADCYIRISHIEKNYQTSLQHFVKLKKNENFGSIVPYYIAQIFYLQGKYDSAIVYAKPLLDSANVKRIPELTKIIGESYYRTSRYAEAIPFLEKY